MYINIYCENHRGTGHTSCMYHLITYIALYVYMWVVIIYVCTINQTMDIMIRCITKYHVFFLHTCYHFIKYRRMPLAQWHAQSVAHWQVHSWQCVPVPYVLYKTVCAGARSVQFTYPWGMRSAMQQYVIYWHTIIIASQGMEVRIAADSNWRPDTAFWHAYLDLLWSANLWSAHREFFIVCWRLI